MSELEGKLRQELIDNANFRLDENLRMVKISLSKITEDQVWRKPNEQLNSIGNLILHLCGNLTQYGISSLTDSEDRRQRDKEFSTEKKSGKEELYQKLESTVDHIKEILSSISNERLVGFRSVQGYHLSGTGNIIHFVEHFSYHTGQIAFWVKMMNSVDLGFYDGQDLNAKNQTNVKG